MINDNNKLIIVILGAISFLTIILSTITFMYILNIVKHQEISNEILITLLSIIGVMFTIGTNVVSGLVGYLGGTKQ